MRATLCFALFFLSLHASVPSAQDELTSAQMEEDLFQLWEQFDGFHAGLLRYTSRDELDEVFGDALLDVAEPKSELEFFRTVARLVSKVRCGHTSARQPQRLTNAVDAQRGLLPLEVYLDGERLFVTRSLDGALTPGTEIVSIDGRSVADIRSTVYACLSADGLIETGKRRVFERNFARNYALFVQSMDDDGPFVVQCAGDGAPVTLAGMLTPEYFVAATEREGRPVIDLDLRPQSDLALLRVSTFGDPDGGSYPRELAQAFERVRASEVNHLILDLRGNGGGNDEYGALLVSYFTPEPFGYFARIEVSEQYEGEGEIVERDGMRLVTTHPGSQSQAPSEPGFRGQAFVFTDGWTFSTAADVATVMHHNGLATFVGEETGGGYDGNTSGITPRHTLEHSGIAFSCPLWMYTTANIGHAFPGRGVIPDVAPERSIRDVLIGRDVELDYVLDRIAQD